MGSPRRARPLWSASDCQSGHHPLHYAQPGVRSAQALVGSGAEEFPGKGRQEGPSGQPWIEGMRITQLGGSH